jgi:hypothetical protein
MLLGVYLAIYCVTAMILAANARTAILRYLVIVGEIKLLELKES